MVNNSLFHNTHVNMATFVNADSLLERANILTTISSSWKTCIGYYHSYGITKNYILFLELPLMVNGFKLATCTPKGKPLKDCFEWHPNENVRSHNDT